MKQFILLFISILFAFNGYSQHTISGFVREANSGEAIVGATIAVPKLKTGTYTNKYGFYSITLNADSAELWVDFPGYNRQIKGFVLNKDYTFNVDLTEKEVSLDEVVITEQKARENVERASMGVIDMDIEEVELLPFIAGEKRPV